MRYYALFRERLDAQRAAAGLPPADSHEAARAYQDMLDNTRDKPLRRHVGRSFVNEHSTLNSVQQFGRRP